MNFARRGFIVLFVATLCFLIASSSAWSYDPFESEEIKSAGFEAVTNFDTGETYGMYCKTYDQIGEEDQEVFPDIQGMSEEAEVDEIIDGVVNQVGLVVHPNGVPEWVESMEESEWGRENSEEYASFCIDPDDPDGDFACFQRNPEIPAVAGDDNSRYVGFGKTCWTGDGVERGSIAPPALEDAFDFVADPAGFAVDSFAQSLAEGFQKFFAELLFWWLTLPHPELTNMDGEDAGHPAGKMWPLSLFFGACVGFGMILYQAIRMMVSNKPGAVLNLLRGLATFAVVCAVGVGVTGVLTHGSEDLTDGIVAYADENSVGCLTHNEQVLAGEALDFPDPPEGTSDEDSALAQSFAACAVNTLSMAAASPILIVLYVVALLMSIVQGILLFVREAALPILVLLLPIAAAGQIGGAASRRWLPGVISMILTILLYKPMVAFVYSVGFLSMSMSSSVVETIRGILVLFLAVVAPYFMLKSFKPLSSSLVEGGGSFGSSLNNAFMASQMGSSVARAGKSWSESRTARQTAARSVAHEGGGGIAITATKGVASAARGFASGGPVGAVASAAGSIKDGAKTLWNKVGGGSQAAGTAGGAAGKGAAGAPGGAPGAGNHPGSGIGTPGGSGGAAPEAQGQLRTRAPDGSQNGPGDPVSPGANTPPPPPFAQQDVQPDEPPASEAPGPLPQTPNPPQGNPLARYPEGWPEPRHDAPNHPPPPTVPQNLPETDDQKGD